jgi:hypothetical protein
MPYIRPERRVEIDPAVKALSEVLKKQGTNVGDINYAITTLMLKLVPEPSYERYNNTVHGVLNCVDKEFYRRWVVPYEEKKMQENGDVVQ